MDNYYLMLASLTVSSLVTVLSVIFWSCQIWRSRKTQDRIAKNYEFVEKSLLSMVDSAAGTVESARAMIQLLRDYLEQLKSEN